jgi:hypothetical protein
MERQDDPAVLVIGLPFTSIDERRASRLMIRGAAGGAPLSGCVGDPGRDVARRAGLHAPIARAGPWRYRWAPYAPPIR